MRYSNYLEIFGVAFRNLKGQRLRTLLTLLGIIIGIGAITALVSIGQGLNAAVEQQFKSLGSNTLIVMPGKGFAESTLAESTLAELKDDDIDVVRRMRGIEVASELYITTKQIEYKNEKFTGLVVGIEPEQQDTLAHLGFLSLTEGRELRAEDNASVIIGAKFGETAFDERIDLRHNLSIEGYAVRVVGISEKATHSFASFFNSAVMMPADALNRISGEKLTPSRIIARVEPGFDVEEVRQELIGELKDAHSNTEDFQVITASQITEIASSVIGVVQLVLLGIAAISLVVGGIGMMNTMFMAVVERTREIGVMKAVGATNYIVLSLFVSEAALIGLFGGIIGAALGFATSAAVSVAAKFLEFDLPFVPDLLVVAGVLLFAMFVGIVSGIYPAYRAARLDPVEALREE